MKVGIVGAGNVGCACAMAAVISRNGTLWNISLQAWQSFRLNIRELHHPAPLLRVFRDKLAEVGGRARKHRAAEVVKPRPCRRISESCIDLLV
jgi:hypothetical protein